MYVKPDALRYAAGLVEKEWGGYGYGIERVWGSGEVAAVFVTHFDGSRFVIAADNMTGRWGHVDGEDDDALTAALERMAMARYVDGHWSWDALTDHHDETDCPNPAMCRAHNWLVKS